MFSHEKTIAVFGSAQPCPSDPVYLTALEMGSLLGQAGYTVVTGGYSGVMEAASRGAYEAGASVIGVTAAQIEAYGPYRLNQWVTKEIKYPSLRERLLHLVTRPDGFVIMTGGIGTLSEMALVWSFVKVGEIPYRPIVCIGSQWQSIASSLEKQQYILPADMNLISIVDTPVEAVRLLEMVFRGREKH